MRNAVYRVDSGIRECRPVRWACGRYWPERRADCRPTGWIGPILGRDRNLRRPKRPKPIRDGGGPTGCAIRTEATIRSCCFPNSWTISDASNRGCSGATSCGDCCRTSGWPARDDAVAANGSVSSSANLRSNGGDA